MLDALLYGLEDGKFEDTVLEVGWLFLGQLNAPLLEGFYYRHVTVPTVFQCFKIYDRRIVILVRILINLKLFGLDLLPVFLLWAVVY